MPRQARRKSESGIYHIMLRGINQQQIFEDEEDSLRFLETLLKYKEQCGYEIYAYCLMGNHIHILLKEGKENLTLVLKRIAGSYVYWYNWKYRRSGHLFQDRFKSEPVEDDEYFLTVIRYIHQNPIKAGIRRQRDGSLISFLSMQRAYRNYSLKKTGLFPVFFALRSVMYNFVIIFIYQILNKYKLIPFVFQAFEDVGECGRGVVGIIVE